MAESTETAATMDRHLRDRFKGTENYDRAEAFISRYDDPAFDSSKALLPIRRQTFTNNRVCNQIPDAVITLLRHQ